MITDEERSVHTVMLYLNESKEYGGGETVFYAFNKETDKLEAVFTERANVKGAKGDALIFQHNIWHEVCQRLFPASC